MNLIDTFEESSIKNNVEVKDFLKDFDFCISYFGNNIYNGLIFIKRDLNIKNNDIVAVTTNNTSSPIVTLRRVIKVGEVTKLVDIQNSYPPIIIGSSEEEYKILGKAIYRLCEFD